ncbi:hypothetical protein HY449_04140 [Candidatus Pacearchaeota archaeon]|nr:hypothetical protein [Candidatus Pacearchaeota archaeon]
MEKRIAAERKKLQSTINYLKNKKRVLFLTTSNRWNGEKDIPKSSRLAHLIKKKIGNKAKIIDASKLAIYPCEGNVSTAKGNNCGVTGALLKNKTKNPSGFHRCFASINNKDDELWKISKTLFKSDCVVFFSSVRWGQANSIYQKLIERLTWIENRHTTLGEENIVKNIDAGIILVGQNWNGKNVVKTEKEVLKFFGFNVINNLCWNWQYTNDENDESQESYKAGIKKFRETFIKM